MKKFKENIFTIIALGFFRSKLESNEKVLSEKFPYIASKFISNIAIGLSIFKILKPLVLFILMMCSLFYNNLFLFSILIFLFVFKLKESMSFYEITYGKINERINMLKCNYNKNIYNLFKVFDPVTFFVVFLIIIGMFINLVLRPNFLIIALLVIFFTGIYFILNKFDLYFQLLSLLNWGLVAYILSSVSNNIKWDNILNINLFIKDNINLLHIDFVPILFLYIKLYILVILLSFLVFTMNLKIFREPYKVRSVSNKDLASYINFVKSLAINRRLSLYFPANLMVISLFPLLINIPAKKEMFILFLFMVNCIYTKKFMYKYPYFFHYFTNKKEAQLFRFGYYSILKVALKKLSIILMNQYIYISYLLIVFLFVFGDSLYYTDIFYLIFLYICSIVIPLSEKKFILFDYQTMKFNKDNDYGGNFEIITSFIFLVLAMVKVGLEVKSYPFNILLVVLIISLILLLTSICKLYMTFKKWRFYYDNI